jgi:hypothetical protein
MTIYTTDAYEIKSIMQVFVTEDGVETWDNARLFIQGLPASDFPNIQCQPIDAEKFNLIQEDFDVLARFTANVVPIFETTYLPNTFPSVDTVTWSTANSAISPVSMYQDFDDS